MPPAPELTFRSFGFRWLGVERLSSHMMQMNPARLEAGRIDIGLGATGGANGALSTWA